VKQLVFDPAQHGTRMTIACFISGSGTNYREIVYKNPNHNYVVFTNRPDCEGVNIARANKHPVVVLSHVPYLRDARKKYGAGNVPRNCEERIKYEQDLSKLLENSIGGEPDLICLAGFDQWLSDWTVDRYCPRILNVHPGDTTRGYDGLGWIPSAKAILAGDEAIRSTLFIADKGEDTGPVLVQSEPLIIRDALEKPELLQGLSQVEDFAKTAGIKTYGDFKVKASEELIKMMESICTELQNVLKIKGDWKIYPFAVDLIAGGRVALDGRGVYVDGKAMPEYGYRLDSK
jgi:phosphoribosylglycinamide formyltransferase 1